MYETDLLEGVIDLHKITRITVVTDTRRVFEQYDAYDNGVVLSIQDDGRTLKILPNYDKEEK